MTSDLVASGVRRIPLPLPLALRIVNVYLVEGDRGWALVDSGLHTPDGEGALRDGLAEAGIAMTDVRRAFITHLHPDHLGMAGMLARAGAEVVMHEPELAAARDTWATDTHRIDAVHDFFQRHGMPAGLDDEMREAWLGMGRLVDAFDEVTTVIDGEIVDLGGRPTRAKWTPGHTDHHAVLVDEREAVLFSGDHVLPKITSNISLYPFSRDDPLADFMGALREVRDLPVKRVLPAHGDPFDDLPGRVDAILAHHEARLATTLDAVDGKRDAYAICAILFPVLRSAHETRFALAETLAHLRHLERRGAIKPTGDRPIRWRAV